MLPYRLGWKAQASLLQLGTIWLSLNPTNKWVFPKKDKTILGARETVQPIHSIGSENRLRTTNYQSAVGSGWFTCNMASSVADPVCFMLQRESKRQGFLLICPKKQDWVPSRKGPTSFLGQSPQIFRNALDNYPTFLDLKLFCWTCIDGSPTQSSPGSV